MNSCSHKILHIYQGNLHVNKPYDESLDVPDAEEIPTARVDPDNAGL